VKDTVSPLTYLSRERAATPANDPEGLDDYEDDEDTISERSTYSQRTTARDSAQDVEVAQYVPPSVLGSRRPDEEWETDLTYINSRRERAGTPAPFGVIGPPSKRTESPLSSGSLPAFKISRPAAGSRSVTPEAIRRLIDSPAKGEDRTEKRSERRGEIRGALRTEMLTKRRDQDSAFATKERRDSGEQPMHQQGDDEEVTTSQAGSPQGELSEARLVTMESEVMNLTKRVVKLERTTVRENEWNNTLTQVTGNIRATMEDLRNKQNLDRESSAETQLSHSYGIKSLETQVASLRSEQERMGKGMDKTERDLAGVSSKIPTMQQGMIHIEAELDAAKTNAATLAATVAQDHLRIDTSTASISNLETVAKTITSRIQTLATDMKTLRGYIAQSGEKASADTALTGPIQGDIYNRLFDVEATVNSIQYFLFTQLQALTQ
jgi:hypothetical protein